MSFYVADLKCFREKGEIYLSCLF